MYEENLRREEKKDFEEGSFDFDVKNKEREGRKKPHVYTKKRIKE